jgi:hypothetical protein
VILRSIGSLDGSRQNPNALRAKGAEEEEEEVLHGCHTWCLTQREEHKLIGGDSERSAKEVILI